MDATPVDPRRAARSTLLALAATALEKGGGMLMLLLIARWSTPDDFGRFAALLSFLAFFQVVAELGQEPVLVRLLAQARVRAPRVLVDAALALRLALSVAAGVLLVAIGVAVVPELRPRTFVLAALGLIACSGAALRAFFRTEHRIEWLCVVAFARIAAFGAALLGATRLELGLDGAVAAWGLAQLGASVAALALAERPLAPRPRWHAEVVARLVRSGAPLALNAFLLTVTLRVGQLIVLAYDDAHAVAYLAAGSRLAEAFALLPEAVMLALLPALAATDLDARASQRALTARAIRWLALLALPVVLVTSIAAPTFMRVVYGPDYVAGAPALQMLAWLALLGASGTVFTNLLIARGYERLLLLLNGVGSALTLALSLVAIPVAGFVGAAAATLAASVLSQAILLVVPSVRGDAAAALRPLAIPTAAAVALSAGGIALGGPELPSAAVAVVVLAVVVVASGAFDAADWRLVRRALGA